MPPVTRGPPMVALLQAVLPDKYSGNGEAALALQQLAEEVSIENKAKAARRQGAHKVNLASWATKRNRRNTMKLSGGLGDDHEQDSIEVCSYMDPVDGKLLHWPEEQDEVEHVVNPYLTELEIKKRYGSRLQPYAPNHDAEGSVPGGAGDNNAKEGTTPPPAAGGGGAKNQADFKKQLKDANHLRRVCAYVMEWRSEVYRAEVKQEEEYAEREKQQREKANAEQGQGGGLRRTQTKWFQNVIESGGLAAMNNQSFEIGDDWELDPAALHQKEMMKLMEEERAIQDNIMVSIKSFLNNAGNLENAEENEFPEFKPVLTQRSALKKKKRHAASKKKKLTMGNEMLMSALPVTAATDIRSKHVKHNVMEDSKNAKQYILVDDGDDEQDNGGDIFHQEMHPLLEKWLNPNASVPTRYTGRGCGSGGEKEVVCQNPAAQELDVANYEDELFPAAEGGGGEMVEGLDSEEGGCSEEEQQQMFLSQNSKKSVAFAMPGPGEASEEKEVEEEELQEGSRSQRSGVSLPFIVATKKKDQTVAEGELSSSTGTMVPTLPSIQKTNSSSSLRKVSSFAQKVTHYGKAIEDDQQLSPQQVNRSIEEQLEHLVIGPQQQQQKEKESPNSGKKTMSQRRKSSYFVDPADIEWNKVEFPSSHSGYLPQLHEALQDVCYEEGIAIPSQFLCPISQKLMSDPVFVYNSRINEKARDGEQQQQKKFVVMDRSSLQQAKRFNKDATAPMMSDEDWELIQHSVKIVPHYELKKRFHGWRANTASMIGASQSRREAVWNLCTEVVYDIVNESLILAEAGEDEGSSDSEADEDGNSRKKKAAQPGALKTIKDYETWPVFDEDMGKRTKVIQRVVESLQFSLKTLANLRALYATAARNSDRVESEFDVVMHQALRVKEEAEAQQIDARLQVVSAQRDKCATLLEKLESQFHTERIKAVQLQEEIEEYNAIAAEYNAFLSERHQKWSRIYLDSLQSAYSICQLLADRVFVARGRLDLLDRCSGFLHISRDTLIASASRYAAKLLDEIQKVLSAESVVKVYGMDDPMHQKLNPHALSAALDPVDEIPLIPLDEMSMDLLKPIYKFNVKIASTNVTDSIKAISAPLRSRKSVAGIAQHQVSLLEQDQSQKVIPIRPTGSNMREPFWHFQPPPHFRKETHLLTESNLLPKPPPIKKNHQSLTVPARGGNTVMSGTQHHSKSAKPNSELFHEFSNQSNNLVMRPRGIHLGARDLKK